MTLEIDKINKFLGEWEQGPAISRDPAHWTLLERQQFLEMTKTSFVLDNTEVGWEPWDRNEGRWQDQIAGLDFMFEDRTARPEL